MDPSKVSFYNEILLMMFGFGDSHKPNPETVRLVESIVKDQIKTIVQEALKFSSDGKTLYGEELVFLLKYNKTKMRRFVRYLYNKNLKKQVTAQFLNNYKTTDIKPDEKPKMRLLDFIEDLDETGEFTDLSQIDEVKLERQTRADRISQALNEQKYLEFCKARTTSFSSKGTTQRNLEKFGLWINLKGVEYKMEALDVLAYLAYQTVAEIVDFALLIRMDAKCSVDVFNHLRGSYYTGTMFNNVTNTDFSRVYNGQNPINVNEIKEVMRRMNSPQGGILNFGGKLRETKYLFAL